MAAIAQKWRFRLEPGQQVEPLPLITLRVKNGLRMIAERRAPTSKTYAEQERNTCHNPVCLTAIHGQIEPRIQLDASQFDIHAHGQIDGSFPWR